MGLKKNLNTAGNKSINENYEISESSTVKETSGKNKQLVPFNAKVPSLVKKESALVSTPMVIYAPIDSSHYSFTYAFDETISFRMDESENTTRSNDFVEADFSEYVPESHKVYYSIAAASGTLTGALSFIKLSEESLNKIEQFKKKDWQSIIIYAAELAGCKKNDYKSASKYLVDQAIRKTKKDEKVKEYMTLLASHPTMAGLVFSMIVQFAGRQFTITEPGEISEAKLPKYYYIGETNSEKIVSAILYWIFSLAANQAQSKRSILDNLGIPVELLKKLKSFANISFVKDIPNNYEDAEKQFSDWLRETISGAELAQENDTEEQQKLIVNLMRIAIDISKDAFPILINECVVRRSLLCSNHTSHLE